MLFNTATHAAILAGMARFPVQCGDVPWQNPQVARQERLMIQQKATSLPNWRSLLGDPALALVGEYRTKEREKTKISRFPPRFTRPVPIGGTGW